MLSPRVLEAEETLTVDLNSLLDGIGMQLDDALALSPTVAPDTSAAVKEEFLVDLEELFFPKVFLHQLVICLIQLTI